VIFFIVRISTLTPSPNRVLSVGWWILVSPAPSGGDALDPSDQYHSFMDPLQRFRPEG
jgi:hypothetical protein